MSIKNKISVISILVGVMFLGVSVNAMENSEKEESQSGLNEGRNIINSEKEVNLKKSSEIEQETKELNGSINNQEKDKNKSEEELRKFGYGETKEEQQKTKEWVESWGFNNEFIYKKMETNEFVNINECLNELIKEREKNLNDLVKELEKYEFLYMIETEQIDYYDNFYGKNDNYEKFEVYKKDLDLILPLLESRNINKNVIIKYIEEVLFWNKEEREKIENYGQLIKNALDYLKKNNNNEIKSEEELREELRKFGYGETEEEQETTKNWIKQWGLNNEEVYKNMKMKKYKNVVECMVALIKEETKKFSKFIDILAKYPFKFKINRGFLRFKINKKFLDEEVEYEEPEINEEELKKILKLIGIDSNNYLIGRDKNSKYLSCKDIKYFLSNAKEIGDKIKDYKQLIWNTCIYNRNEYRSSYFKFIQMGFGLGENKKYFNIYNLNFIYDLQKEYEDRQISKYINKSLEEIEEEEKESLTKDKTKKKTYDDGNEENSKITYDLDERQRKEKKLVKKTKKEKYMEKMKQKQEELNDKNVSENLKNNEIVKLVRLWIEKWGGNLINLCGENKLITLETVEKYLEAVVEKEIKGFDKVLDRFSKHESKLNKNLYKYIDLDEFEKLVDKPYTYVPFFDFKKIIKEIKKENKEIEKEYGFKINEEYVCKYVSEKVRNSKPLIDEIKNYKQIIWNTYTDKINWIADYYTTFDELLCKSNFNIYKFHEEGFNLAGVYDENYKLLNYLTWKQGKYDIYRRDSLDKIKKEYEEIKFILEMRKILEEIKTIDEKELLRNINNILKEYNEKTCSNEFGDLEVENKISCCFKKMKYIIYNEINNSEEKVNYFERFTEVLEQAVCEGVVKNFIDEIINLTKEEYYTGRFIEKFKKLINGKYCLKHSLEDVGFNLKKLIQYIEKVDRFNFLLNKNWDFRWYNKDEKSKMIMKNFSEYIKKDYKILNKKRLIPIFFKYYYDTPRFFDYYYVSLLKELVFKNGLNLDCELEKRMENNFEDVEKVRDIYLFIKEAYHQNITKEVIRNLIKKIEGDINEQNIKKLKEIYKLDYNGEQTFDKNFFVKILNLADDFAKENLLDFKKSKFFERLDKLIEDLYIYKKRIEEIKKILYSEVIGVKLINDYDCCFSNVVVEKILDKFKDIILEKNIEKFEYLLNKLRCRHAKKFSSKIIDLIKCCSSEDEFKKLLSVLIEQIYKINIRIEEEKLERFLEKIDYSKLIKMVKEDETENEIKKEIKEEKNLDRISDEDFYNDYFGINITEE